MCENKRSEIKFIQKWIAGYDKEIWMLQYEYRGIKYVVEVDPYGTPVAWQHRQHQEEIDNMLKVGA